MQVHLLAELSTTTDGTDYHKLVLGQQLHSCCTRSDSEPELQELHGVQKVTSTLATKGSHHVSAPTNAVMSQGSDGSGTSDEGDFDDDQMFQMDDKIAAALKVMAKGGANARESREAISSFKFRVIGLLDIYVKKA